MRWAVKVCQQYADSNRGQGEREILVIWYLSGVPAFATLVHIENSMMKDCMKVGKTMKLKDTFLRKYLMYFSLRAFTFRNILIYFYKNSWSILDEDEEFKIIICNDHYYS